MFVSLPSKRESFHNRTSDGLRTIARYTTMAEAVLARFSDCDHWLPRLSALVGAALCVERTRSFQFHPATRARSLHVTSNARDVDSGAAKFLRRLSDMVV